LQALFISACFFAYWADKGGLLAGTFPAHQNSNGLRIAIHRPGNGDTLVVLVVEDNLVKGASGQGVQCLNLMFGLPETMGLTQIALSP
jgi:N-acetyl-gamma-glutamylphosphate reductase